MDFPIGGGMARIILCILLLCSMWLAQGSRILIVTDLEGAGGVNDAEEQLLPGQRRYVESRRILIGEVNAAVEGGADGRRQRGGHLGRP
jgi:hypothetical protein